MGFDEYHEPPEELSLIEEAEAIDWYVQRLAVEKDEAARAVPRHAQKEEFIHFGMDLEFLLRHTPVWRNIMRNILNFIGNKLLSASLAANPRHLHPGQVYANFTKKPRTFALTPHCATPFGQAVRRKCSRNSWLKRLFPKKSNVFT